MKAKWYDAKTEIAVVALPMIQKLRKKHIGYPGVLWVKNNEDSKKADKEWTEILKKIETALTHVVEDDLDTKYEITQEGLELFGKWFWHLWD